MDQAVRVTEIFANPAGVDRGNEWVELCAGAESASLSGSTLTVGTRKLNLSGTIEANSCSIVRTGTAAIRNREADVTLTYRGATQYVRTAGSAPDDQGFHIKEGSGFWASSTPGVAASSPPLLPPLPKFDASPMLWSLLGTAACTAGILTALATVALRNAKERHDTRPR